jgi:hypothetical protein
MLGIESDEEDPDETNNPELPECSVKIEVPGIKSKILSRDAKVDIPDITTSEPDSIHFKNSVNPEGSQNEESHLIDSRAPNEESHLIEPRPQNEESHLIDPRDLTEDETKTPSSRKSVTFSADLEDVEELIEDEEDEEEANEDTDAAQNEVFSDENSFLLGPEFEGIEPTYV